MKYRNDTKAIEAAIRTLAAEGQITEVRAFEAVLKNVTKHRATHQTIRLKHP